MKTKITIAISIGDPAGIGPEITFKALQSDSLRREADWLVVGDRAAFAKLSPHLADALANLPGVKLREPGILTDQFTLGQISEECGRAAVAYVREATELCLRGEAHAMVTAPLNKEAVRLFDGSFTGHTDYIAELCKVTGARMMLAGPAMRVLHVTTHCSLRKACESKSERILDTIRLGDSALRQLGYKERKIAVCGLNPHASEHGAFGDEEQRQIEPAIAMARSEGINCEGPVPADTVFLKASKGGYDLVVAMYHDQGHIPMKLLAFETTVNVSLGLPIIRTSVDHGTAFDIAGKSLASAENMTAAMQLALTLVRGRNAARL